VTSQSRVRTGEAAVTEMVPNGPESKDGGVVTSESVGGYVLASTVGDVVARGAELWPEDIAMRVDEESLTYAELLAGARMYAASFLRLGVNRGDHVGLLTPASTEFYQALFGAVMVGAVAVPLNYRFRGAELAYVIRDSECVLVATTSKFAPELDLVGRLQEAFETMDSRPAGESPDRPRPPVHLLEEHTSGSAGQAPPLFRISPSPEEEAEIDRIRWLIGLSEPSVMFYTSGTTSRPKGVPLTHEAVTRVPRALARRWQMRQQDALWNVLPTFHIGGLNPALVCFWVGATYVGRSLFDAEQAVRDIESQRCTVLFTGFPKITSDIYENPTFAKADMSHVRMINNAAPPDLLAETSRAFPSASVITPYGQTEVVGAVAFGDVDESAELRLTSGKPVEGVEVRVVDPETGEVLSADETGEFQVRTFAMLAGYHNDPAKTAETMTDDGWLRTGDLGTVLSSGHVKFIGRLSETMKVGGENVAPAEIEALLLSHEGVRVAQVAGVPDAKLGEVPAAWIELDETSGLMSTDLIAYCESNIARYKVPRYMRFVSEWPMSATKIQKAKLVEELVRQIEEDESHPLGRSGQD
jgi:fatty-acyl-CoA synthase